MGQFRNRAAVAAPIWAPAAVVTALDAPLLARAAGR
jgi:hypothetical protein